MIGSAERALLAVLLIVLMIGMGATLEGQHFKDVLRSPKGVLIGVASQFGWMPLIAFGLSIGLGLSPALAIGLLIVGSTPGGTTSNLFTYYSRADVALSISMTVCSTIVAVVAMPLLVAGYAQGFEGLNFGVPIGKIATTLALILVPVGIGMAIRKKSPSAAARAEKLGSISGVVVLIVLIVSMVARNSSLFAEVPVEGYIAALSLGALGLLLGYGAAALAGLRPTQRRAISLETGIQNSPLAFAIVLTALPEEVQAEALRLPMLYAFFVLLTASVATLVFRTRQDGASPEDSASGESSS